MARCIVHVGMHKTGTSSIQHSLRGLSDARFLYADLGPDPNHSLAVCSLFAAEPGRHPLHRGRGTRAVREYASEARRRLDAAIAAAGERTLVLSGEGIGWLEPRALEALAGYLRERCSEVRIAAYVRAPAAYIASAFQERVRNGQVKDLDLAQAYRGYRESFEKFDAAFGRTGVSLWKFDTATLPGGCVVRDFCARIGIDLPRARIVRINDSLSRAMVRLLYSYVVQGRRQGLQPLTGPEAGRMSEALASLGGGKFRFATALVQPVLEAQAEDIAWMEQRLGESLDEPDAADDSGVRDEAELLRPDARSVALLRQVLGDQAPQGVEGQDASEVAQLMHLLRRRLRAEGPPNEGDIPVTDILEQVRREQPELLAGIPVERARALIEAAFAQVRKRVAAADEGVLGYAGLGRFRVRKVERQVDGRAVERRAIAFHPD